METERQKISPAMYFAFAGNDRALWCAIIGQRLYHSKFGSGTILGVEQGENVYVRVQFDSLVESAVKGITDTIELASKAFVENITDLTLPADLLEKVQAFEQQRQEEEQRKQEEKQRRQEELERAAQLSPEELLISKHRAHVSRVGVPYLGTRRSTGKSIRKTHCWKCTIPIDNITFFECVSCGWIICDCGACGCGFPTRYERP